MLDLDAHSLEQIAELLCEHLVTSGQLAAELSERVKDALLLRHRHQHEKHHKSGSGTRHGLPLIRSLADIGRNSSKSMFGTGSSASTGGNSHEMTSLAGSASGHSLHLHASNAHASGGSLPADSGSSSSDLLHRANQAFMRKVPVGAEADNILVGEVQFLERSICGFVRLQTACNLGDLTEVPVPTRFLFLLLGPPSKPNRYHEVGRALATLMSDDVFHDVAYKAKNRQDLLAGVDEFLDAVTVLPPGAWDPSIRIEPPQQLPSQDFRKKPEPNGEVVVDEELEEQRLRQESGLERTGRLFGGLLDDLKRKRGFYWSDFTDALALQSVASVVFLYFACLAPIITFGGLLADATGNYIATMESLLTGAICGIVYGLFSGQPLTILGSTGPVLVFETIMYSICTSMDWYYLTVRFWIGLWTGLILLYMVAVDASAFVCYITRFTEESFATLISVIFIVKAFEKTWEIRRFSPIYSGAYDISAYAKRCNTTDYEQGAYVIRPLFNQSQVDDCVQAGDQTLAALHTPDVFLFSVGVFIGTYALVVLFKELKTATFFPTNIRQLFADFAVILAIGAMTLMDHMVALPTPKLLVPSDFRPTRHEDRGWLVPLLHPKNPIYLIPLAVFPALLATILIFMDQQITAVIVNRKENKLKKGCGYHLDLFILALLIITCSLLGLPWFVAATVLSMTHVNSLRMESESAAPGEKPQFLGVREQRVTHVTIFVLCGLSIFFTRWLQFIPMPVLYGVFLYMGTSSLHGSQFFERILLVFMPQKYQPDYMYLRHVRTYKVHLFTLVQVLCFVMLWVIKSNQSTSITFPLMLVVIIGVRKLLEYFFSTPELKALDDVIPESTRRDRETQKQDEEEAAEQSGGLIQKASSGNVAIALANGNILKIPVESFKSGEGEQCNITEQLAKSNVWRSIDQKQRKPNKGKGPAKQSST
jgi:sodium bicarbonate transporter 10